MQKQGWQNQSFLCWVAALVMPTVCHGADPGVTDSNTWTNNIPPRLQWEAKTDSSSQGGGSRLKTIKGFVADKHGRAGRRCFAMARPRRKVFQSDRAKP